VFDRKFAEKNFNKKFMFKKFRVCLPFGKPSKREKSLVKPNKIVQEPEKQTVSSPIEKKKENPTRLIPVDKVMNKYPKTS